MPTDPDTTDCEQTTSTALMVMLEEIGRQPSAFTHAALAGACIGAKREIERLRTLISDIQAHIAVGGTFRA